MKNEEIMQRLNAMGLRMYSQQLSKTFSRPFYCGLINHALLEGKVIEGNHPKLISPEPFMKVNNIRQQIRPMVPHCKENNNLPLKMFIRCAYCEMPFTGYLQKVKNIYYYKCRTLGCKCNKNANKVNAAFLEELAKLEVSKAHIPVIIERLKAKIRENNKEAFEEERTPTGRMVAVQRNIDEFDDKFYLRNEISQETHQKYMDRFLHEKRLITQQLENAKGAISNLDGVLKKATALCANLATMWNSGEIRVKEKLQNLVFPDGIFYDAKKRAFLTPK